MMDWTDRHCRAFHRTLTRRARLYTEMLTPAALIHGNRLRLLEFSPIEHPIALQLGGSDPIMLAQAARIGADWGYDEINLNVGCPSDRVQSGQFGACLMRAPDLVAEGLAAMRAAVPERIPVSVKCRIGVDDDDPHETLPAFIENLASAGTRHFIIHARKAWLQGLSPKENREIPALDYPLVHDIKAARPDLTIVLNGGLLTLDQARQEMQGVDGVMLGRAAYRNPAMLLDVDPVFYGVPAPAADIFAAIEAFLPYVEAERARDVPLHAITRHMLGLFHGRKGGRAFRRVLGEEGVKRGAGPETLGRAMACIDRGGFAVAVETGTPRRIPRPDVVSPISVSPIGVSPEFAAQKEDG